MWLTSSYVLRSLTAVWLCWRPELRALWELYCSDLRRAWACAVGRKGLHEFHSREYYSLMMIRPDVETMNETRARCNAVGDYLALSLFEAFADAVVSAEATMAARRRSKKYKYNGLFSYLVRVDVREHFIEFDLPEGWELSGNPELSGQLKLREEKSGSEIRVLKRSQVTKNGVPHAGTNRSRRQRWRERSPYTLFAAMGLNWAAKSKISQHDELLLLWGYDSDNGLSLRLVHPVEPGQFGGTVKYDYSYDLVIDGTLHEGRRFDPDASEEYQIMEVDVEDNEQLPGAEEAGA